jgi:hypothetical protein
MGAPYAECRLLRQAENALCSFGCCKAFCIKKGLADAPLSALSEAMKSEAPILLPAPYAVTGMVMP